ncbi:hypothetical protein CJ030_MR6G001847 [Morella rubra]|uniref:Uncharacterized protein n=1 Tax=Morella rubra TaxID=262757 RepID=A0A6A1VAB0_9ROSI|nr:hypothetical protein CJ030_MR6G001847 [Morella rubra]
MRWTVFHRWIFNFNSQPSIPYLRRNLPSEAIRSPCWCIKNGGLVNIWCDPWIPCLPTFCPTIKPNALLPWGTDYVKDLIDSDRGCWKEADIRMFFDTPSASFILATPLLRGPGEDLL